MGLLAMNTNITTRD